MVRQVAKKPLETRGLWPPSPHRPLDLKKMSLFGVFTTEGGQMLFSETQTQQRSWARQVLVSSLLCQTWLHNSHLTQG